MCFGWRITEYTSTDQIYSDENPHNCQRHKDKLFAPSFDTCCPISNSAVTKVVIAKHSTCKESHFRKLNGGLKHLKHICGVGEQRHKKIPGRSRGGDGVIICVPVHVFVWLRSLSQRRSMTKGHIFSPSVAACAR